MGRPSRILVRLAIAVCVLLLLVVVALMLVPDNRNLNPRLPFDTNGYFSTSLIEVSPALPPHPSFRTRVYFAYFKWLQRFHPYQPNPTNTTFSAGAVFSSVQILLDQCTQASGTRYVMPPAVAMDGVHFGSATPLNGRQWIDAIENVLQTRENLVLIHYPKQKAVLVLTASEAAEFRRTNSTGIIDQPKP